jgi:hypothetical protein
VEEEEEEEDYDEEEEEEEDQGRRGQEVNTRRGHSRIWAAVVRPMPTSGTSVPEHSSIKGHISDAHHVNTYQT